MGNKKTRKRSVKLQRKRRSQHANTIRLQKLSAQSVTNKECEGSNLLLDPENVCNAPEQSISNKDSPDSVSILTPETACDAHKQSISNKDNPDSVSNLTPETVCDAHEQSISNKDNPDSVSILTPETVRDAHEHENETKYGRRIINVDQFFSQLQEISSHGPLDCGLKAVQIISETRTGLLSMYTLKCKMCGMKFHVYNDVAEDELDLNISAVAGTVATGSGYTQLTDLSAAIGIPPMSKKIFTSKLALVNKKWEEELYKSMTQAAEEERSIAIKEGRVTSDGIAIIDVIADGCYSKRSYRKNYSALSGAAAIIGKRTNKILYLSIKNKYCSVCSVAQSKNVEAKEHTCYKNYSGPSTGMESDILVEGFKRSIDMHNLIYGRLISDGDANTYSKILQARPYPKYEVEKVECRNHLLRNMCNKLAAISTDTKYILKFRKYVTKKRILSIRKVIIEAIKKHKNSDNVTGLFQDISAAPEHAFGYHQKCKDYFCTKPDESGDIDQGLFSNSMWQRVKLITNQIAVHARSLIVDVDSNAVERYHSIVAKFVGGKRINFTQRYQYQMRCHVAALSFNTQKPLSALHKSIVGESPRNQIMRNERNKQKSRSLTQKYSRKKRRLFPKEDSRNYGENCSRPDLTDDVMRDSKEDFLKSLEKTAEERKQICQNTILQSGSSEWIELRRNILTASNFGRVIKRRKDISCQNMVKDILYKRSIDHVASVRHGMDHEKDALQQLAEQEGVNIQSCGLYIDAEIPYFGATPDGIVPEQKMVVEVKCPKTCHNVGVEKAVEQKKIPFYNKTKNGVLEVNKHHNWYYQIQGQLHITKMEKCLFGIWSGANLPVKTEIIFRDDKFWSEKMEAKLKNFYLDCLLPEIIDPRHTRKMAIRDPSYVLQAIENKTNKKTLAPKKRKNSDENTPPPSRRRRL